MSQIDNLMSGADPAWTSMWVTRFFARLLRTYLVLSPELQESARKMAEITEDCSATEDERIGALATLTDILFPTPSLDWPDEKPKRRKRKR